MLNFYHSIDDQMNRTITGTGCLDESVLAVLANYKAQLKQEIEESGPQATKLQNFFWGSELNSWASNVSLRELLLPIFSTSVGGRTSRRDRT